MVFALIATVPKFYGSGLNYLVL